MFPEIKCHLLRLVIILTALIALVGCEPGDYRAGAWLSGEEVDTPVTNWTFTDVFHDCFIESDTWYVIPHSVKLWCAEHEGEIYVGSYGEGKRTWEKHILSNGEGALRVDGRLYAGRFELVEDPTLTAGIVGSYIRKYSSNELWHVVLAAGNGSQPDDWRFYRLRQGT